MFALIDCNNFYVSCERIFNPKLKNQPVVILSNNDGCIISRSNEAKPLVKMGDPIFLHKKLIFEKKLIVYSSNFALYGDMSNRVMQTIKDFGFDLEIYSIDEAFLKMESSKNLPDLARQIKRRVEKNTGIPVSIGIGTTKTLAKIASDSAKKQGGVLVLEDEDMTNLLLQNSSVKDIWGIGFSFFKILKKLNINTAKEFKESPVDLIRTHLKTPGVKVHLELNGHPAYKISINNSKRKSILCSRSFSTAITSLEDLEKKICWFVDVAAEKLRRQKSLASYLTVFLATSRFNEKEFYANHHTAGLTIASDYTPYLFSLAKNGLKKIFKANLSYKRAGVIFSDLIDKKIVRWISFLLNSHWIEKIEQCKF